MSAINNSQRLLGGRLVECLPQHCGPLLATTAIPDAHQAHLTLLSSLFFNVRGGRLAVRRLVPGRSCSWLRMSSAGLQLVCAMCEAMWKEKVLDEFTFGTSCGMTKPVEPSLPEQCQDASKAGAETPIHGWCTASAPYAQNAAVADIVKEFQHPFVGLSKRPCLANVE